MEADGDRTDIIRINPHLSSKGYLTLYYPIAKGIELRTGFVQLPSSIVVHVHP
jgi:hypothetical protein